jgi:hypothetical protein
MADLKIRIITLVVTKKVREVAANPRKRQDLIEIGPPKIINGYSSGFFDNFLT